MKLKKNDRVLTPLVQASIMASVALQRNFFTNEAQEFLVLRTAVLCDQVQKISVFFFFSFFFFSKFFAAKALAISEHLLLLLLARFTVEDPKLEFLDPLMLVEFEQLILDFRVLDLLELLQLKTKHTLFYFLKIRTQKKREGNLRSHWD